MAPGFSNKGTLKMQNNLIPTTCLVELDSEPRILDIELAERLEFERPRVVRELIARNRDELETYGGLPCHTANPGNQGGRPGKAYYLNEGQALVICALSRTEKAAAVRKMLIDVFMAYRQGKIVEVRAHRRRPPNKARHVDEFDHVNEALQAFVDQPEALIQVLARCVVRLDALELSRN
jgi:hypothetical protein